MWVYWLYSSSPFSSNSFISPKFCSHQFSLSVLRVPRPDPVIWLHHIIFVGSFFFTILHILQINYWKISVLILFGLSPSSFLSFLFPNENWQNPTKITEATKTAPYDLLKWEHFEKRSCPPPPTFSFSIRQFAPP